MVDAAQAATPGLQLMYDCAPTTSPVHHYQQAAYIQFLEHDERNL
jgi:hypothetical protein